MESVEVEWDFSFHGLTDGVGVLEQPTCRKDLRSPGRWGTGPAFCPTMEGLASGVSRWVADQLPLYLLCIVANCVSEFH